MIYICDHIWSKKRGSITSFFFVSRFNPDPISPGLFSNPGYNRHRRENDVHTYIQTYIHMYIISVDVVCQWLGWLCTEIRPLFTPPQQPHFSSPWERGSRERERKKEREERDRIECGVGLLWGAGERPVTLGTRKTRKCYNWNLQNIC